MNDLEDRLRLLMADVTRQAPGAPGRAAQLRRRIAARRRLRAAGAAGLAVVAVVAVVGASAGLVSLRDRHGAEPGVAPAASVAPTGTAKGGGAPAHATLTGPKNVLLVRIGAELGLETTEVGPDSIMVMHVPAGYDHAYLTSIPLSTYVEIPAYNNGSQSYPGGKDAVKHAYTIGAKGLTGAEAQRHGMELLTRTLTALSGLTFDAAAVTDLAGLGQVVTALGGVDLYVDEKTTSVDIGYDGNGKQAAPYLFNSDGPVNRQVPGVTPVVYDVGMHHFAASQAVDYTRQRYLLAKGDGEYGRDRHQQQLVKAVYQELTSSGTLTNPTKLQSFLTILGQAATIDTGGVPMADWLFALRGLNPNDLVTIAMNDGKFNPEKVGGYDFEMLSDTSLQLLRALHDDTVDGFVAAHPDWVSSS